jgi:acetolactate synthase small subunit
LDLKENLSLLSKEANKASLSDELDAIAKDLSLRAIQSAQSLENLCELSQMVYVVKSEFKVTKRAYKIINHMIDLIGVHGFSKVNDAIELDFCLIQQALLLLKQSLPVNNLQTTKPLEGAHAAKE